LRQAFYRIRSERLLLEQLHYNLLLRWFVGLSPVYSISRPTIFTKNEERLLNDDAMGRGRDLKNLMRAPDGKPLPSSEHFSMQGNLLHTWVPNASLEQIN
jgi:hypothetical protein